MSLKAAKAGSGIHPASQVHYSMHTSASLELFEMGMSRPFIKYAVDCVLETVHYALGRPSTSRGRPHFRDAERTSFRKFVTDVITRAEVTVPVLMVALVYVHRAKPNLDIATSEWANERTFLGALILANKYLNDSTLKNIHWALASKVFRTRDIGRIEREFLDVLDFELGVSEADILYHHGALQAFMSPNEHIIPNTKHAPQSTHTTAHSPASHSTWSSNEGTLLSESPAENLQTVLSPRPAHSETNITLHPTLMGFVTAESGNLTIPLTPAEPASCNAILEPSRRPASPVKKSSHHRRLSSAINMLRSISISIPYLHNRLPSPSPSDSSSSETSISYASSSTQSVSGSESEFEPDSSATMPSFDSFPRRMGAELTRPVIVQLP